MSFDKCSMDTKTFKKIENIARGLVEPNPKKKAEIREWNLAIFAMMIGIHELFEKQKKKNNS